MGQQTLASSAIIDSSLMDGEVIQFTEDSVCQPSDGREYRRDLPSSYYHPTSLGEVDFIALQQAIEYGVYNRHKDKVEYNQVPESVRTLAEIQKKQNVKK